MKIYKIRSLCYKIAKLLGDYNAIRKGKVLRRAKNRIVGKWINKCIRW